MNLREIAATVDVELDEYIWNKDDVFILHQIKRKIRYYCFSAKNKITNNESLDGIPTKLINHFKALPQFEGWKKFGDTWDVKKSNPLEIYFRDFSINQEWDAVIRRVVPELPVDRKLRQSGPESNI